jgi:putative holliday junction resolvase
MTAAAASGVWIAVDVGSVRVGVARSDPAGLLAVPVATLARDARGGSDIEQLAALVAEHDAVGVVVGLPRTLAGREGSAAAAARSYGEALGARIAPVPIVFVDERLSSVTAARKLRQSGVRTRAGRKVIDQAAAVEVLQQYLDTRRAVPQRTTPVGHDGPDEPDRTTMTAGERQTPSDRSEAE